MPGGDPDNFTDPALKAALRDKWGRQQAPDALRRRVAAMAIDAHPAARTLKFRPKPMAAAAVMVLGISALVYQFNQLREAPPAPPHTFALDASVMHDLAERHDACSAAGNHFMPGIARDDYTRIAADLKARLNISVLAASPGPGFIFEGASICTIGGHTPAAHLLFRHGPDSLSVFSMPATAIPDVRQGAAYAGADGQHDIMGFVYNGGFYCAAGSTPDRGKCRGMVSSAIDTLRDSFAPVCTAPLNSK